MIEECEKTKKKVNSLLASFDERLKNHPDCKYFDMRLSNSEMRIIACTLRILSRDYVYYSKRAGGSDEKL